MIIKLGEDLLVKREKLRMIWMLNIWIRVWICWIDMKRAIRLSCIGGRKNVYISERLIGCEIIYFKIVNFLMWHNMIGSYKSMIL